jgi:hypothetical protein
LTTLAWFGRPISFRLLRTAHLFVELHGLRFRLAAGADVE